MVRIPNEVRTRVRDELGEDGVEILKHLADLGKATDTDLAELLGARTSQIRKALYGMYGQRVADYAEHRDPATGWLTFVWQYTPDQAVRAIGDARRKAADELKKEIEAERGADYYQCPQGHGRLEFSQAMDHKFQCPDCGTAVQPEDKDARLAHLRAQLEGLEKGEA